MGRVKKSWSGPGALNFLQKSGTRTKLIFEYREQEQNGNKKCLRLRTGTEQEQFLKKIFTFLSVQLVLGPTFLHFFREKMG